MLQKNKEEGIKRDTVGMDHRVGCEEGRMMVQQHRLTKTRRNKSTGYLLPRYTL